MNKFKFTFAGQNLFLTMVFSLFINEHTMLSFLKEYLEICILGVGLLGFVVNQTLSTMALIIAKRTNIYVKTNNLSVHSTPTPPFGGISLFMVFICTSLLMLGIGSSHSIGFIILSAFILFILGLKDDFISSTAQTKLIVQITSAIIVLINSEITVTHLSGFFGIEEIDPIVGSVISIGFIVFFINAYNLIDGIDGLASVMAIIAFSVFGVYFYINNYIFPSIIMASMIGALLSFMTWNFASPTRKMFMGDTGSLVIGFILAYNALIVLTVKPISPNPFFEPQNAVIFVLSIFVIPVLDTIRIIIFRISNDRKPWVADLNHMHHVLLDNGLTHKEATICLGSLQLIAIFGYIGVNNLGFISQHLFLLCLYSTYATIFFYLNDIRNLKEIR